MKFSSLLMVLSIYPVLSFANLDSLTQKLVEVPLPAMKNTIVVHYSNDLDYGLFSRTAQRTIDFPTQIVRINGNVEGQELDCDEVIAEIDAMFTNKISFSQFTYNTYVFCGYDPETELATNFIINSYFDPLTDQSIDYLKNYLAEYNGKNLLGTPFIIENAKGIVVSINISAGLKGNSDQFEYMLYHQDQNSVYFKTNYTLKMEFIKDIYNRFYSNDPKIILPFLDKWISSYSGGLYSTILKASNYVALQPERIFIMENEGDIFVSNLKFYYAHSCSTYPNKHCL